MLFRSNGDHDFCHLIEMQLNGLTVRLTEVMFDVDDSGDLYLGNGILLDIDGAKETAANRIVFFI